MRKTDMSKETIETAPNCSCSDTTKEIFLAQIRECFGRVAYSHKAHEKQADIMQGKDTFWKWIQIILSVIASGSFLVIFSDMSSGHEKTWSLVGAVLSALLAAINLCFKDFNYSAKAQQHKEIAVQLWNIRETYISLIADFTADSIDSESARKARDQLQDKLTVIYKNAPRTTDKAYSEAKTALRFNEELTFSSNEIDMLLTDRLRLNEKREAL